MIEAVGEISSIDSLLSTLNDNNGAQANMFAVTALQETTISDFAMNLDAGTADWIEVHYRPDNFDLTAPDNSNTSGAGWTLVGNC